MKTIKHIALFITFSALAITGCKKDKTPAPEPELPKPTIDKVEIGLGNNEIGVTGRDFHFDADIVAGYKIDVVEVKISPIATETYAEPWSLTKTWTEFKGAKNTNVHKHFDIPANAVEGKYDFIIRVKDENGTELVEKRKITIIKPENLPVDPEVSNFVLSALFSSPSRTIYNIKTTSGDGTLKMNETTTFLAGVNKVKGDGKLYVVLINKKHNHRPESIDAIDYSKAIILNVREHSNLTVSGGFSNLYIDNKIAIYPNFTIGAAMDNNKPTPNPINGLKAWETGTYYVGMLYKNTTYNVSLFRYTEVSLTN